MQSESEWIDAVEMSRRLRIETGEKLAQMTAEERIRFLNDFATSDPTLKKMKRADSSRHSVKDKRA